MVQLEAGVGVLNDKGIASDVPCPCGLLKKHTLQPVISDPAIRYETKTGLRDKGGLREEARFSDTHTTRVRTNDMCHSF